MPFQVVASRELPAALGTNELRMTGDVLLQYLRVHALAAALKASVVLDAAVHVNNVLIATHVRLEGLATVFAFDVAHLEVRDEEKKII